MTWIASLLRRLDPRSSVASRLLLGYFLAFCIPGAAFVFLLEKRLSQLEHASARELATIRISDAVVRLTQDARFRAEWIDRRVRLVEEAGSVLADALELALAGPAAVEDRTPVAADSRDRTWVVGRASGSTELLLAERAENVEARGDLTRTRSVSPVAARLLERRPMVRNVTLRTVSGAVRRIGRSNLEPSALENLPLSSSAPNGASWAQLRWIAGTPVIMLSVPVRADDGTLLGRADAEVDARRLVHEPFERTGVPGDLWFATDSVGRAILMSPRAQTLLGCAVGPNETFGTSSNPICREVWDVLRGSSTASDSS
ncbi:MAG TPA: hypothetical protein VGK08_06155, partial [Thermoanaerobaculia bacterium]